MNYGQKKYNNTVPPKQKVLDKLKATKCRYKRRLSEANTSLGLAREYLKDAETKKEIAEARLLETNNLIEVLT